MLKKNITYTDFEDNTVTEECLFNLTEAELVELQTSYPGGYEKYLRAAVASQDSGKIVNAFKDLILRSYGERSADGKRFIKTPEIAAAFASTEAYSTLFMELATDADKASAFLNGIVPKKAQEAIAQAKAAGQLDPAKLASGQISL